MSMKETLVRFGNKALLQLDKHSPQILVGLGIATGVAATGLAVYSTLKVDKVVDHHQNKMADIARKAKQAEQDDELVYEDRAKKHDKAMVYVETGAELTRLYMPTILLTGVSVACVLSAHHILDKRYTAAAAAFTAVSKEFSDYRSRVRKQFGEEKERDIYQGIVEKEVVDDETGETKTERTYDESTVDKDELSRFFDEYSIYWDKNNPDQNIAHIRSVLHQANDQLYANGHLFLNDVYRMLGIADSKEGAVLGWIVDDEHQNTYVDFGVYGVNSDDPWDFLNGETWDGRMGIRLTFNVDGIIYDKI